MKRRMKLPDCSKAQDVNDGKWRVHNAAAYIVVRRDGEIIADAIADSNAIDGVSRVEFVGNPGHTIRRKVSDILRQWVEVNRETVYSE